MKRLIAALFLPAALVLATACGGGGGSATTTTASAPPTAAAPASPTSLPPSPVLTAPPIVVTPAPTPSVPANPCVAPTSGPIPPAAQGVSTAPGDFNGDGKTDQLATYLLLATGRWHIRIGLAGGYALDQEIAGSNSATPAIAIGGYDVDGDGSDEAFVTVGSGADTRNVGLYDFDKAACTLDRVLSPNGQPAVFPVGMTVGQLSGLECVVSGPTRGLVRTSGGSSDGNLYHGQSEFLSLAGHQLISVTTEASDFQGPTVTAAASFTCDGLTLP